MIICYGVVGLCLLMGGLRHREQSFRIEGTGPGLAALVALVLLPETWAAVRAARADRLQTSLNLAIGSALASIGLTVPASSPPRCGSICRWCSASKPRTWCCWR